MGLVCGVGTTVRLAAWLDKRAVPGVCMRQRFIWDRSARNGKGDFIPIEQYIRPRRSVVQVISDIPAYKSPLGDGWIEGRAARREHFKRTGTREVDPSEFKGGYTNERFARKHGGHATHDPEPQAGRMPTWVDGNWRENG